ncbi:MAG: S41 family peptidase [Candidatus Fonsibacter sp.]|nr:S41 family peptidase [Candidatus Fonsibacter sp.]
MKKIYLLLTVIFLNLSSQNAFSQKKDALYEKLDLFGDILETINKEYFKQINEGEVIDGAINGMLQSLDPYSSYMSPKTFKSMNTETKGEFGGLGIEVTMESGLVKVISPIDDTPADKAGIKSGDYIIKLDNKQVKGLTLDEAVNTMRGKSGTAITLTIRRIDVDEPIIVKLVREIIKTKSVVSEVKDNVGYLRLRSFNEKSGDELIEKIREINRNKSNITGYILDLRNNPGGLLSQAIKISDAFLESGEIVSTKGRDPKDIKVYNSKKGDEIGGKPLIVLINKGSASASEIVAGALKDHKRAIIIGEKSFGKGSVQSIMPLSNGGGLRLTTAKYYLPSGETIEEIGVQPDIKIEQQKDNFKINDPTNDNQLIYALKLLKTS